MVSPEDPVQPIRNVRAPSAVDLLAASACVRETLEPTPVHELILHGHRLLVKNETVQPTGSFKVRGALAALGADAARAPVVTCSAGNHGLGVAFAASVLDVPATVVVPATASEAKLRKLREFTIDLRLVGETYDEAEAFALNFAQERGERFISPYNDTHVIAGQATIVQELRHQVPNMAHVVVAVGGGGLAAGCSLGLEGAGVRLHGAQVTQNAAFAALFRGDPVGELAPTIADGIAGGIEVNAVTLEILQKKTSFDMTLVEEAEVRAALRAVAAESGLVIEGSAAVAVAAALKNLDVWPGDVVVVLSGGNIAHATRTEVLESEN